MTITESESSYMISLPLFDFLVAILTNLYSTLASFLALPFHNIQSTKSLEILSKTHILTQHEKSACNMQRTCRLTRTQQAKFLTDSNDLYLKIEITCSLKQRKKMEHIHNNINKIVLKKIHKQIDVGGANPMIFGFTLHLLVWKYFLQ